MRLIKTSSLITILYSCYFSILRPLYLKTRTETMPVPQRILRGPRYEIVMLFDLLYIKVFFLSSSCAIVIHAIPRVSLVFYLNLNLPPPWCSFVSHSSSSFSSSFFPFFFSLLFLSLVFRCPFFRLILFLLHNFFFSLKA